MGMELNAILMSRNTLENGKMEKLREMESSTTQMEAVMRVKYQATKQTAVELLSTKTGKPSLEHGLTIFRKVKELNSFRMVANIKAIFVKE